MKLVVQLDENESIENVSSITVAEAVYNTVRELNNHRKLWAPVISLQAVIEILAQQVIVDSEMEKFLQDNAPAEEIIN